MYTQDARFVVTMYYFVLRFRKAKFCGVRSRVIVKIGRAIGKNFAEH
jgi:hypothetical protein